MGNTAKLEQHRVAQRREDLIFLADQGETFENAAKRLGISPSALDQWLQRHDKGLRARLNSNGGDARPGHVRGGRVRR